MADIVYGDHIIQGGHHNTAKEVHVTNVAASTAPAGWEMTSKDVVVKQVAGWCKRHHVYLDGDMGLYNDSFTGTNYTSPVWKFDLSDMSCSRDPHQGGEDAHESECDVYWCVVTA